MFVTCVKLQKRLNNAVGISRQLHTSINLQLDQCANPCSLCCTLSTTLTNCSGFNVLLFFHNIFKLVLILFSLPYCSGVHLLLPTLFFYLVEHSALTVTRLFPGIRISVLSDHQSLL